MDNQSAQQITAPAAKAITALGAGGVASVGATATNAGSFMPTNFNEWMAAAASFAALCYTTTLMCEWLWKRMIRPYLVSIGKMPAPKGTSFTVDEDGNVTRVPAP